jgi:uncharacterized protein (TIGR03790 family)
MRIQSRATGARAALILALGLSLTVLARVPAAAAGGASGGDHGLTAAQLAVVINSADPLSVAIGEYYAQRRRIPPQNIARVSFGYHRSVLPAEQFAQLKSAIDAQLPASVQAYALTWVQPYRVDCMSITSAFAFGFDARFCADGCVATRLSPYFNSSSGEPYADLHLRPAMSIAATSFELAKALIDRGVSSDGSAPQGTAYLLTSDGGTRDVRAASYPDAQMLAADRIKVAVIHASALQNRNDVMFYFVGSAHVQALGTNQFLPGAVADHLTSAGGALTDSVQMSSLRWLEAGATGSYGTVVEPCNFTTKFPNPGLLMRHYLTGETLIEAYWKSVAMPGQGIFIGEPLARPYRLSLSAAR